MAARARTAGANRSRLSRNPSSRAAGELDQQRAVVVEARVGEVARGDRRVEPVDERPAELRPGDVVALGRLLRDQARLPPLLARVVFEARLPQPGEVVHLFEPADPERRRAFAGRALLHEVDELALPAGRPAEHEEVLEDGGRRRGGRHRVEHRSAHSSSSAFAVPRFEHLGIGGLGLVVHGDERDAHALDVEPPGRLAAASARPSR